MQRRWLVGLGVLSVAVVAGWLLWPAGDEPAPVEEDEPAAEEEPAEDPFAAFFEAAAERPLEPAEPEAREGREGRRERWRQKMRDMTPEQRREWRERRRQAWRERMASMTPEERREFYRRFIEIVPMGDEDPELEPEDVAEALRDTRSAVRDCMREQGGFRAFRDAMRQASSPDAGARGRGLSISFDVTPEGTVPGESIAIEPAPPEPFYSCFADALAAADMPQPRSDARVEMRMGGRRGRVGRRGDESAAPAASDEQGERREQAE